MVAVVPWRPDTLLTVAVLVAGTVRDGLATAEFRLTLLHTNDMHSRFDETCRDGVAADGYSCNAAGGYGGFARLQAALDAERLADPRAVYLFAGDAFQGSPFYSVLGWEPVADFVGDLGIDAMCLGNHEFEEGPKELGKFLASTNISSIPIVAANIHTEEEPSLTNIRPSTILRVGDRTVGVIGYLTPDTKYTNKVGKIKINDELRSIKSEVIKLKRSGVEFIIALGHSGLEMDRRVAREVDGIDAVIGGHSHSYLISGAPQDTEQPVGPYPIIENRGEQIVPVVQAYAFAKYLGKLVLTFNDQKRLISAVGGPIFLDQTIPEDKKTLKKVKYYKQLLAEKEIKEMVGITKVNLDGNCKCSETNLANIITDSYIRINLNMLLNNNVTLKGWTDAATAISLSGCIQNSINVSKTQGKIYNNDIELILPYKTPLLKATINGSTLQKALEHSASLYDYANCAISYKNIYGGFMQMSGMRVVYNMKNPVGSRVQSVMMQCSECKIPSYEPINPDKRYKLIMSNYIANGGDQYKMIKEGIINAVNLNITETDAFRAYIKTMSPIYAKKDHRITILN